MKTTIMMTEDMKKKIGKIKMTQVKIILDIIK